MRTLTQNEVNSIEVNGGNILVGALVGGMINSAIWAGWTVFVDNNPEKINSKKCLLTFALGTIATATGIWFAVSFR